MSALAKRTARSARGLSLGLFIAAIILLAMPAFGHGEEIQDSQESNLPDPVFIIEIVGIFLIVLTLVLVSCGACFSQTHKVLLFLAVAIPVALSSIYLASYTVYENIASETGGPVHWHADYQVWVCDQRLDLHDPRGMSNKIGTSGIHEHNDDRIHIEGTLRDISEASLGNYFKIIGVKLDHGYLRYPTNEGIIEVTDGELCNEKQGKLNVYVNGKKEVHFEDYVIYPSALIPPGDCIIINYGEDKQTTDKYCESWKAMDWDYADFTRRPITIGDHTWQ